VSKSRTTIRATKLFEFAEIIGDRHLITATVGPNLDPVVLSLEQAPDYRNERPGWASFAKKRADSPNRFRMHHLGGDEVWETIDLPETVENFHHVQSLGENQWLLVRGRSDDEEDLNAHIYDGSGRHMRSFHAGDGIQDLQTTKGGRIWVSYFDEGVFGSTKLGHSGLVCLDDRGRCLFDFASLVGDDVPSIADCYALNVCSDREVWLCYYTDFPLVRLLDGKPAEVWLKQPVRGSPGFAVLGELILFSGGYHRKDELFLVQLGDMKNKSIIPVDSDGTPVKAITTYGRRDRLFLQSKEVLFVVSVSDTERTIDSGVVS
jgi:hypothetical protein